jgi:hypothetical protein
LHPTVHDLKPSAFGSNQAYTQPQATAHYVQRGGAYISKRLIVLIDAQRANKKKGTDLFSGLLIGCQKNKSVPFSKK